jgi:hypothetical protein
MSYLAQSKNIDVLATLPGGIHGPGHDICVSYLKKIGHAFPSKMIGYGYGVTGHGQALLQERVKLLMAIK